MKKIFSNIPKNKLKQNPLIYKFSTITLQNYNFGITQINPGKIGKQNYMTSGHKHKRKFPEIYFLIKGKAQLILKNKNKRRVIEMKKNRFYLIKPEYFHRVINTGKTKLIFGTLCHKKAGHIYKF